MTKDAFAMFRTCICDPAVFEASIKMGVSLSKADGTYPQKMILVKQFLAVWQKVKDRVPLST